MIRQSVQPPILPGCSRWLAVVLGLAGVLTVEIGTVPFDTVRGWLDNQAGDGSAEPYSLEVHWRVTTAIQLSGLLTVVLAAVVWERGSSLLSRIPSVIQTTIRQLKRLPPRQHGWIAVLCAVAVCAFAVRYDVLDQPMRFDEAYTWLNYSSQPLYVTVSRYDAPNNHVAHSVLAWVATRIGGNSPQVLRLPAFIAGVLTAVGAGWLACRWSGIAAAFMTGCLVAVWSPLVEYSVNARGYTLLHLMVIYSLIVADEWLKRPRRSAAVILGGLSAIELWTIPTAVYPLVMLILLLIFGTVCDTLPARRRKRLPDLATICGVTVTLTAMLYLPIFLVSRGDSLWRTASAELSLSDWAIQMQFGLQESAALLFRDQSMLSCSVLAIGLSVASVSIRPELRLQTRAWISGIFACLVLLAVQCVVPPARTWLFLAPWGVTLAASGLEELLARPGRIWCYRLGFLGMMVVCSLAPWYQSRARDSVRASLETGVCPDARGIIEALQPELRGDEPIIATSPTSAPLAYYGLRAGLPRLHFQRPEAANNQSPRAYVVVSRTSQQTVESVLEELELDRMFSTDSAVEWREYPSATVYQVTRDP